MISKIQTFFINIFKTKKGLRKGQKVIVVSNEPENISVGKIVGFDGLKSNKLPIVKIGEKEYLCFSIVVPYNKDLFFKLDTLPPIEAWNYLALPHAQIEEKYGVKYKTYNNKRRGSSNLY